MQLCNAHEAKFFLVIIFMFDFFANFFFRTSNNFEGQIQKGEDINWKTLRNRVRMVNDRPDFTDPTSRSRQSPLPLPTSHLAGHWAGWPSFSIFHFPLSNPRPPCRPLIALLAHRFRSPSPAERQPHARGHKGRNICKNVTSILVIILPCPSVPCQYHVHELPSYFRGGAIIN